jgi:hypothetical protein
MARKIIWLFAVLLVSAAGVPKPAGAVTFEFIQTSDPATSDGYVAEGTLVVDDAAFLRGVYASLPGPTYNLGITGIDELDFGIAGFGVSLDSFIPVEPPQCIAGEPGTCYFWDISVSGPARSPNISFDYFDAYNDLAFDGPVFGSGGAFFTDNDNTGCIEGGCFFAGYWQLIDPAPVPEPASFGLLASGVLGLAALRRRRARA